MTPNLARISTLLFLLTLAPSPGYGQTSEENHVEHLEASELGRFDPEHRPNLEKAVDNIVDQTNEFRKTEGRDTVEIDPTLQETAAVFAKYMARTDKYGHRADDRNPGERAKAQGYQFCMISENIAYQFQTLGFTTKKLADSFVTGWKNSPGHRKNMLEPDVTQTGAAVSQSEATGVFYAVQLFGRPKSEKTEFRLVNKSEFEFQYQIAEKRFSLPPRYARKHTLCRPAKIRWQSQLDRQKTDPEGKPREIEPADGEEFGVKVEGGRIVLKPQDSPVKSDKSESSSPRK